MSKHLNIMSWNVNGIRAALKKGFLDFFHEYQPDILCLQETRALPEQVELDLAGYKIFWNPAEKKGYSGTALITRIEPQKVSTGLGGFLSDLEGRVLTAEFAGFYLVNVYTPNAQRELARLSYRCDEWDRAFGDYVNDLQTHKPVVFCGDLNVAHKEIDLANPKSNRRNAGFTDEERQSFERYLQSGFLDTFRHFNQEPGHYTWWSQRAGVREKNIGWRIDYVCVHQSLSSELLSAKIHPKVMGSDHCPVSVTLAEKLIHSV